MPEYDQPPTPPAPEENVPPPPPASPPPAAPQSSNRSIMLVLSYVWILALVPLLVEKEDAEVQWHAKHGIVLTVAEIVLWVVLNFLPLIGCMITSLISLGVLILRIFLIIKALDGKRLRIPVVSDFADKWV